MSDSLLQAVVGNPLDLLGLGQQNHGMTLLFPLSQGNTVNDLANVLNVPVDAILAVNPGLQANSPLSLSQVVGLPDGHVEQIMQSVSLVGNRAYLPSAPSPSPSDQPPQSNPAPVVQLSNQGIELVLPATRSATLAFDVLSMPQAQVSLSVGAEQQDGWTVSIIPAAPVVSAPISVPAPAPVPVSSQPVAAAPAPVAQPEPAAVPVTPAVNLDPDRVAAASPGQFSYVGVNNAGQGTNAVAGNAPYRQRNPSSDIPPPPIDPSRFAGPVANTAVSSNTIGVMPPVAINSVLPADGRPLTLQMMALMLAAQSAGSIAPAGAAPAQVTPFIDPQALAAIAVNLGGTRVVDLGAGRSMEFSLVNDRLRRVDPIGEEDRPSARRTGDGLDEVRVSPAEKEQAEQTDEQREQGRRRRAAIAAMRRRRRARTRRCRYWRGARSELRAGARGYPKQVDLAEFRSRQVPRYMWTAGKP
ncbi:hypothetical protein [Dyella acidiphila]|uniref:LysM domain-containing protein n=1 Tax=Dyella acidiphila TaxID=2775866 RepID=A0ABR9GBM2_9GAMM|nr:hypothetical protein [Dyella acidiphila]MBE1161432.1 hypothetical protein [Dyella acidiphila]